MAQPIKAVAFDLYGTLLNIDALAIALQPYTPMAEAMRDAWRQRQLQLANAVTSSVRYVDFDRITLTALHEVAPRFHAKIGPAETKILIDAWAHLPTYDDVIPTLRTAFKSIIPLMVITNAVESTARNALAYAGIDGFFSDVISADAVKVYKPKKAVYDQVLALGIDPSEVLMVTANDWDAMGARQAGFHTIWVNRKRGAGSPKPERVMYDLFELEHVLTDYTLAAL
ncbi:MAG TPA: haloacid dehalogenase type II [Candidatus Aquilonibacter sp.]|nr:haloacid dehalogenase type II [Candidatus Aquilonibacter sp.]